jgi:hypothetical protein
MQKNQRIFLFLKKKRILECVGNFSRLKQSSSWTIYWLPNSHTSPFQFSIQSISTATLKFVVSRYQNIYHEHHDRNCVPWTVKVGSTCIFSNRVGSPRSLFTESVFGSVIVGVFQITFRAKMHVNIFFYFLKIIFDISTLKRFKIYKLY